MLVCLRVKNFAIIDELEVDLRPGLNVVTGETGAGKSILVDALELVLGGRGKPEIVRTGEKAAEVEAIFDIADDPVLRARLEAAGVELDDPDGSHGAELIIRRVLPITGRSRAYVNGRLASTAELSELALGLADISSQHEHHRLTDPASHLDYLDAFARLDGDRAKIAALHETAKHAREALDSLVTRVRDRGEREDLLRFQIREIEELDPQPGESETLVVERERLRHATKLARSAGGAEDALYTSDEAIATILGKIAADVRQAAAIDPRLAESADRLDEATGTIEDVAKELGRYAQRVEIDPERLAEVEDRIDRLKRLERKYGGSVEDILAHRDKSKTELETLSDHERHVELAQRTLDTAVAEAATLARALRDARTKGAKKLGKAIGDELASLGMGDARIEVALAPIEGRGDDLVVDGAKLSATGIDRAEFLIAPNRGEEARPLRKIASGGELSRAMLAIKRVLAGLGPHGLYVFDEVDTGVGGAVAEVIGRKLAEVAKHHQVICITHLPQIAVYGTTHHHVRKQVVNDRTRSDIRELEGDERTIEIARMLGGVELTAKTRAAAEELLGQAMLVARATSVDLPAAEPAAPAAPASSEAAGIRLEKPQKSAKPAPTKSASRARAS